MRKPSLFYVAFAAWAVYVVLAASLLGLAVWAAAHFIRKYW